MNSVQASISWEQSDSFTLLLLERLKGNIEYACMYDRNLRLIVHGCLDGIPVKVELLRSNREEDNKLTLKLIQPTLNGFVLKKFNSVLSEIISKITKEDEITAAHVTLTSYGWRVLPINPLKISKFLIFIDEPVVLMNLSDHLNNPFERQNIEVYCCLTVPKETLFFEITKQVSDFVAWLSLILRWDVGEATMLRYPVNYPYSSTVKRLPSPYRVKVAVGTTENIQLMSPLEVRKLTHATIDWMEFPYFEPFDIPNDAEEMYNKYEKLGRDIRRVYVRSCYAYQEAQHLRYLENYFASFVSLISAIENLAEYLYSDERGTKSIICPCCKYKFDIPKDGAVERFVQFLQEYGECMEHEKDLRELYGLRSKRVHIAKPSKKDELLLVPSFQYLTTMKFIQDWKRIEKLAHVSLLNFLRFHQ